MRIDNFLDLALAAQEYSAAVVDMLWDYVEHASHMAVDREAAG